MEPEAAKLIGAGIACIALAGAGIGIGTIFGNYLAGALRNPSAQSQFPNFYWFCPGRSYRTFWSCCCFIIICSLEKK